MAARMPRAGRWAAYAPAGLLVSLLLAGCVHTGNC
jgi:hypothetical protein